MSRWSSRPAPDEPDALILFDGVCVFCSRWTRFVMDHDPERRFRFTAIQSPRGRALAERFGVNPDAPETNAVILDGRIWFKSDAALKVLDRLPGTPRMSWLLHTPKPIRDAAYDLVAKNRYRIFGRTETCMVPSPEDRARFLD